MTGRGLRSKQTGVDNDKLIRKIEGVIDVYFKQSDFIKFYDN